ncbi:metalloregulator ArsR/SmtB family transcription factor [Desulfosarcina sp. OttesenSCG-928-G10]|nr:metalloregulator ArsR/SmtB family transcription factor [Desulfosarcina sp. OttesenSCG-928-G10]MDL2321479.1 metalloregulator ArsR/SmtB family transcription factor [Desulfosarcina sp. OttesenSCG-928-B08]
MNKEYLQDLPDHWQPAADIFSALGDTTRQRILLLFEADEELSIKDIAGQFDFVRTTIVHHLAVLEKAGVLSVRRSGKLALYRTQPDRVLEAIEQLRVYIVENLSKKDGTA